MTKPRAENVPLIALHKKSNISNFAIKSNFEEEPLPMQDLLYHDIVVIQHSELLSLALARPRTMTPAMNNIDTRSNRFSLFELLPVEPSLDPHIKMGESVYLRNKESALYLSAESQRLNSFANLSFEKEQHPRAVFSFEGSVGQNGPVEVRSHSPVKLRHRQSQLYLRTEIEDQEKSSVSLWLSQNGNPLTISIASRPQHYENILNDRDIILLSLENRSLVGAGKHHNFCELSERRQPQGKIDAAIDQQYTSKENCKVEHYSEERGRGAYLMSCLWEVVGAKGRSDSLPFLIRAGEDNFSLRHLETGLYLCYHDSGLYLDEQETDLSFFNEEKYSCDFSTANDFQPLYIDHPLKLGQSEYSFRVERVTEESRLPLFLSEWLQLVKNIAGMLSDPNKIGEEWEELQQQITFYVYVYRLLQREMEEQLPDGGFYFFQFSLRIVQVVRGLMMKGSAGVQRLLGDMLEQMIKFLSMVIASSSALALVTSEDAERTSTIINLLFVLYPISQSHILALINCLSSADPQLVVSMLSQQLPEEGNFRERVGILQVIADIIDRFRRINFDEQTFQKSITREHEIQVQPQTIIIIYSDRCYNLFELIDALEPLRREALLAEEEENYYQIIYLLSIGRLLYGARTIRDLQVGEWKEPKTDNLISIAQKLAAKFIRSRNIEQCSLVLSFIQQIITEICEQDFYNSTHQYIIFGGELLTAQSQLETVLKIKKSRTLNWLFTKEELTSCLNTVSRPEWEEGLELITQLKFLEQLVELLAIFLTTCSHDIEFLNQAEQFCIGVATLYYRRRVREGSFLQTRARICRYQAHKEMLVVDGVKAQLDILISKLKNFFQTVFGLKQRLFVHPLIDNVEATFKLSHFEVLYSRLCFNQRLRLEVPVLQKLLSFNGQKEEVEALILTPESINSECFRSVENAISHLSGLTIIMESFKLFRETSALKENIVASIQKKMLQIDMFLREGSRHKNFVKCSDALSLPQQLFQFILQNSAQSDIVYSLTQLLYDKISINCNIFFFLRTNRESLKNALLEPSASRYSKMVLSWIGKQIQRSPRAPEEHHWHFLYEDMVALIDLDQNPCIYYLISVMLELGLHNSKKKEELYARIVYFPRIREFLNSCASFQTLKLYRERMEKGGRYKRQMQVMFLELVVLFRLCSGQQMLLRHMEALAPLRELKEAMIASENFFFFLPILSYISGHPSLISDPVMANEILLFGVRLLREYKQYEEDLAMYNVKCFEREKEGVKAVTQFLKRNNTTFGKENKKQALEVDEDNKYYWEFLYWIPFYRQPEGLLVCLEKILRSMIVGPISGDAEETLTFLEEVLSEVRRVEGLNSEQLRPISHQLSLLSHLVSLRQNSRFKPKTKTEASLMKGEIYVGDIYKILCEYDILKKFILEINKEIESQTLKKVGTQKKGKSLKFSFKSKLLVEQSGSEGSSLHEHTHHSLIRPEKTEERLDKGTKRVDRPWAILSFLDRLKRQFQHRPKMVSKMQIAILKYFMYDGSFLSLQESLIEEIDAARDRAIAYREEILEYQWGWRTVPAQERNPTDEIANLSEAYIFEGEPVGLQVEKLSSSLEENNAESLHGVFLILKTQNRENLSKTVSEKFSAFQKLLMKMLEWSAVDQLSLSMVIFNCQYIVDMMVTFGADQPVSADFLCQIQGSLASLLFKVSNLQVRTDNYPIFVKMVVLAGRILGQLAHRKNQELIRMMMDRILNRLPKKMIRIIFMQFIEIALILYCKQDKTESELLYIQDRYIIEMVLAFDLLEDLQFGRVMIPGTFQLARGLFDYLHSVQLSLPLDSKQQVFPRHFLWMLIKLEYQMYQAMKQCQKQDRVHYEDLIISCLGFFHTFSFYFNDKLELSLYEQRQLFFQEDSSLYEFKQVYDCFSKQYQWCLVQHQNGHRTVQVYPAANSSASWQEQIACFLQSSSDLSKRREMILSYCIGISEESTKKEELMNRLNSSEPFILLLLFLCLGMALLDRMIVLTPLTTLFSLLMAIHLIALLFLLFQRSLMVHFIGSLEVRAGRQQNILYYVVKNRLSFVCLALMLLTCNLACFWLPSAATLILLEILLVRSSRGKFLLEVARLLSPSLLGLSIILMALTFLLALTVSPQHDRQNIPVLGMEVDYNIDFVLPWFGSWAAEIVPSAKIFLSVVVEQDVFCLVAAFGIYYFLSLSAEEGTTMSRCQLCRSQGQGEAQAARFHVQNRHNIFKFISCFKYLLFKPQSRLGLKQQQVRKMVADRNVEVFS